MMSADWFTARGIGRVEVSMPLLAIPDIRQAAAHDCGDAVLFALAAFHGLPTPPAVSCPVSGTDPATLEMAARRLGLPVLSGTLTVADLAHLTRTGRPVLCPVAALGGHWVIVRGVDRGRVYAHCPVAGPVSAPAAKWVAGWRDTSRAGVEYDRWGIAVG